MTTTAQKIHHYTITANARQRLAIGAFYPVVLHLPSHTEDREQITAAALIALDLMGYQPQNITTIEEGTPLIVYFSKDNRPNVYDQINPDTGAGHYGGKTLEQVQAIYPTAQLMGGEEYDRHHDTYYTTDPVEIDEEAYTDALECLPPVAWKMTKDADSFKMSETTSGNITGIYARIGTRYFCFNADIRTPHAEALDKCRAHFNI
jgi:hypothetical protein